MMVSHSAGDADASRDADAQPVRLCVVKEVNHHLQRLRTIRRWQAGQLRKEDLADADFLLTTAATFHGHRARGACPLCNSEDLREVFWIYGDGLGRRSGTARTWEEIVHIAEEGICMTVHTVEVCPQCGWNYLLVERDVVKA